MGWSFEAGVLQQLKLLQGLGTLLRHFECCGSHDKDLCYRNNALLLCIVHVGGLSKLHSKRDWSSQSHLSASSTVVSKECAHKCRLL